MSQGWTDRAARAVSAALTVLRRAAARPASPSRPMSPSRPAPSARPGPAARQASSDGYPGDFDGAAVVEYAPHPDGVADPGEVVWAWVPFEEDHRQGKDRPALVIGHDGRWVLALMLTSKDHDRDAADEARHGRVWTDVGTGAWDPRGRASEVRLDRVLRLDPHGIRREGGTLDADLFRRVAQQVRQVNDWA
jgi:PemK-like, MazF-like toxin of type II toxin-antitoxin system